MNNAGLDGSPTTSPDVNNNAWNNIGPAQGINGPRTEEAGLTTNLVASDGTTSSYVLTTGSQIQWNGVRNGGLTDPDPALLGDLAIATATHDYLFIDGSQKAVLNFTALSPEKHYRFNVFGSRLATADPGNRIGVLAIAGANTAYGIHQMAGKNMGGAGIDRNDRYIFVSDLVQPTVEGLITLTLSRSLGMSHINIIKLEEISALFTSYTITYHLNGGEGAINTTYTSDSETITLPIPTKSGYTFLGWYDNSGFTGSVVTEIPKGSTGNKEFWAKWEIINGIDILNGALHFYPNPVVDGKLTIDNILSENGKIEIYNVLGKLTGIYDITGSRTVIDISELSAGTYLVKVNGKIAKLLKR
jgi:uncharacterized repeat protein (TIGR02543 family)